MEYPTQKSHEQIRGEIKADAGKTRPGTIVKKNGKFYKAENGSLVETSDVKAKDAERMTSVLAIRDEARKLLDAQVNDEGTPAISIYRKNLNALYDDFVRKNGILNKPSNRKIIRLDADSAFHLFSGGIRQGYRNGRKGGHFYQEHRRRYTGCYSRRQRGSGPHHHHERDRRRRSIQNCAVNRRHRRAQGTSCLTASLST